MPDRHARLDASDALSTDQTPDYLERLSPVVERLRGDNADFPWDTLGLARLIASFLQFMDEVAGKNVSDCRGDQLYALHNQPLLAGRLSRTAKDSDVSLQKLRARWSPLYIWLEVAADQGHTGGEGL